MTLRQRVFIISGIIVALVLVVLLGVFFAGREYNASQTDTSREDDVTVIPNELVADTSNPLPVVQKDTTTEPVFSTEPQRDRLARQIAGIVVERFQSYSSNNDNVHLASIEQFVTPRMWGWVQTQTQEQQELYQGVTTEVIASRVEAIDETSATVFVDVQQVSVDENGQQTAQRTGRVELTADGDGWLVAGFFWEE